MITTCDGHRTPQPRNLTTSSNTQTARARSRPWQGNFFSSSFLFSHSPPLHKLISVPFFSPSHSMCSEARCRVSVAGVVAGCLHLVDVSVLLFSSDVSATCSSLRSAAAAHSAQLSALLVLKRRCPALASSCRLAHRRQTIGTSTRQTRDNSGRSRLHTTATALQASGVAWRDVRASRSPSSSTAAAAARLSTHTQPVSQQPCHRCTR